MKDKSKIKYYLGIDWGEKRIGLAIAESETKLATPFKVVKNIKEIEMEVKKENIMGIAIGHPIKMSSNKTTEKFQKFLDELRLAIDLPIDLIDERWSTKAITALPGTKKTKAPRDAISAMIILQTYLDGLKE
jgi:putative Holliday junction resolvase